MIEEIEALVKNNFTRVAIGLISQNIETLGAFLDKKPFKTPRQSSIRFHLALKKLFPAKYLYLNNNGFLYKQLRSNFTHLSIESQFLTVDFSCDKRSEHLKYRNGKTTIVFSFLLEDYLMACKKLLTMIDDSVLKDKKMF